MFCYNVDGLRREGRGAPRSLFVLGALLVIALYLACKQLSRDWREERASQPCPLPLSEFASRLPFTHLPPHFKNERGKGAKIIITGDATISYWLILFPVPSNSLRSLYES